ncbi:hypothetical protein LIP55_07405 [[Ruminococcus] gnavus]|nr:hypothetical protein [Mediterraneibacter gnavus]
MFLGNKKCRIYAVLWRFANAYIDRNCEEIQEAVKKAGITDLEASILSGESIAKSNTL